MKFVVIGGGLAGVPTAWYLQQHGHEVTVLDRAERLAGEGSYANGAILHAGNAEPWNSPAVAGQLLRWLGREDSPLLLRARAVPQLLGWGLRFLWHSRRGAYEQSWRANTALAVYSQRCMDDLAAAADGGWDQAHNGSLKVYRDQRSLDEAQRGAAVLGELGVEVRMLDAAGALATEPALRGGGDDIQGAAWFPDDQSGDPHRFCQRLGERFTARGGDLRLGVSVNSLTMSGGRLTGVDTDAGRFEADRYVLAAGADAPLLVRPLGLHLPIRPVKGYSATLPVGDRSGAPQTPIIDHDRKVVFTRLGDRLRVAGMAEFTGFDRRVHDRRVAAVMDTALAGLPEYRAALDYADAEPWACLRPLSADGRPYIGPTPLPNLFLNTGAGHLGWTVAAGAGHMAADMAVGAAPELDPSAFAYGR